MRIILLILSILLYQCLLAQKEGNNWLFADSAWLDFNSGSPAFKAGSKIILSNYPTDEPPEGAACVSDTNGNLLFYSDGEKVWNRQHQILPNGNNLLGGKSATQPAIIVRAPGQDSVFYLFTVDHLQNYLKNGLRYSIIDLRLDGGLGDITVKNKLLMDTVSEKLAITSDKNGKDFWIVTHKYFSDAFVAMKLSEKGITDTVITHIGREHNHGDIKFGNTLAAIGQMKISPNGKKIALVCGNFFLSAITEIFDFDNERGTVSNYMNLCRPFIWNTFQIFGGYSNPYGVSFSPDNSKLYLDAGGAIVQYDLKINLEDSIVASAYTLPNFNNSLCWSHAAGTGLQLGPDGKIYYVTCEKYLGVINSPNLKGAACDPKYLAVDLKNQKSYYSLPSFNDNYNKSTITFYTSHSGACLSDSIIFREGAWIMGGIAKYEWDFGDGTTALGEIVAHKYTTPGAYNVTLTVTGNNGQILTKQQSMNVYSKPAVNIDFSLSSSIVCTNSFPFTTVYFTQKISPSSFTPYRVSWEMNDTLVNPSLDYHVLKEPRNIKIKMTVQYQPGCYDSVVKVLKVFPGITSSPILNSYKTNICVNDSITILNKSYAYFNAMPTSYTYKWIIYKSNGSEFNPDTVITTFDLNHRFKSANNYTVKLRVETDSGCVDSAYNNFYVYTKPIANFELKDTTSCVANKNITLTAPKQTGGPVTFAWSIDNTLISNQYTSIFKPDTPGTKKLKLQVSSGGCADSVEKNFTIYPTPVAGFNTSSPPAQCLDGNTFDFSDQSNPPGGGSGGAVRWNIFKNPYPPVPGNTFLSKDLTHNFVSAGMYKVVQVVTNSTGCSDTADTFVTVYPSPDVDFALNDTACADGGALQLIAPAQNQPLGYEWKVNNMPAGTNNTITITKDIPGTKKIYLWVKDVNSCRDSVEKQLHIMPIPVAGFTTNKDTVTTGSPVIFTNTSPNAGAALQWDFGDGSTGTSSPVAKSYNSKGAYKIILKITENGCEDTASRSVIVIDASPKGTKHDGCGLSASPNPFTGLLVLDASQYNSPITDIYLFDALGRKIYEEKNISFTGKKEINVPFLASGLYVLRAACGAKTFSDIKLVVETK